MRYATSRETVDLSEYPDLVVIYLGMRVQEARGLRTLLRTGKRIRQSLATSCEGLLLHEDIVYGLVPPHLGMRQYWRDFASLEAWARADPHRTWWKELLAEPGGTAFWHETYNMRGGIEAIYLQAAERPLGLGKFAPLAPARKSMFSSRERLGVPGSAPGTSAVGEDEVYGA